MFPIINMIFRPKSTAIGAGNKAVIPHDIIQTHILHRLDGATLASASCASSKFHALCSEDQLWRNICNSTWPSTTHPRVVSAISAFPSAHRSFYNDAFSSMHHQLAKPTLLWGTSELISAVDIYYKDEVIYSKVLATETAGDLFLDHPLFLHLLDPTETVPTPLKIHGINGKTCMSLLKKHLRVSWIVIDPDNKRAVNVASHKAVRCWILQWNGGNIIRLRYSKVAALSKGILVQWTLLMKCSIGEETEEIHVKKVKMYMEDRAGNILSGRMGLLLLQTAMEGRRRRNDWRMEENHYEIFSDDKLYRGQMDFVQNPCLCYLFGIYAIVGGVVISYLHLQRTGGWKEPSRLFPFILIEAVIILVVALVYKCVWAAQADALIQ